MNLTVVKSIEGMEKEHGCLSSNGCRTVPYNIVLKSNTSLLYTHLTFLIFFEAVVKCKQSFSEKVQEKK